MSWFRRKHEHKWYEFAPFKRRCVCGREEWLFQRRFPQAGTPGLLWKDMTQTTETCLAQPYRATLEAESTASFGRYSKHRHDYVDVFFQSLAAWREETAHLSFVEDKTRSPHFKKIVSLGNHVVRLIVDELRQEPSFLFLALEEITGEDHVAPSSYGKPIEMVNDWLQWYENVGVNPSTQRFDTAQRLFPPKEQTHQGGSGV